MIKPSKMVEHLSQDWNGLYEKIV